MASAQHPAVLATRAFIPAKDFETSKAFYRALGFLCVLDGDVAVFDTGAGTGTFIVQNYYVEAWACNCMMQLVVEDVDAWFDHIQGLDLPARFGVPEPKPPAMQPWGLTVSYMVDPAGVLWHIASNPMDR